MGYSQFWLNMADKEIKVHRGVVRMIFPMIHRAKNDRSVRRALPVYDNGDNSVNILGIERYGVSRSTTDFTIYNI